MQRLRVPRECGSKLVLVAATVGCLLCLWPSDALIASVNEMPAVTCSLEPHKSVLAADEFQKVLVKITLRAGQPPDSQDRSPVNLSIVLDRSGSMGGEKIAKAKEAVTEAFKRLTHKDLFSLVVYDHTVQTLIPAEHAKDRDAVLEKIKSIQPGGRTALFGGVTQGATEIRKHIEDKYVHRIILLSDGLANVGPSSPEELGRLGAALLKESISVTTVGVGLDYNEDLMTKLSKKSDGNSYFVESSKDLPKIFAAELGDVLSVRAQKVNLLVECPDGVKPTSIVGREGRIVGQRAEISLNQLYGGQEKYAFLELEVTRKANDEKIELAVATVRYDEPITGKTETARGAAAVRFSSDKDAVEKSVNASVAAAYEMTLTALAQERAILLADKGNPKEAAEELKRSAVRLRSAGVRYENPDLIKKAQEVSSGAAVVGSGGWGQRFRKEMRTDSYQNLNQQRYR